MRRIFKITQLTILSLLLVVFLSSCKSKTKEILYSEGLHEAEKANLPGAVVLYKCALEKDPNYQDARYQLAKAYQSLGKYELAEKEFKKVALQNPSLSDIPLELAKIYIGSSQPDQALLELEKVKTDSADKFELRGRAYLLKKRFKEAEFSLSEAVRLEPKRIVSKLELAGIYIELGKSTETRKLLNEVIKDSPQNFRAYSMLADLEVSEGHRDKALEIYRLAAQTNPLDPSASYKRGLLLIEKGDVESARQSANDLVSRFPKCSEGTRLQGLVNFQTKNYADAIPLLQKSITLQPVPEAFYYLGLCYYNQNNLELALSQFRRILDVNPSAPQARLLIGIILLKQKRVDDSIAELRKLLQINPGFALAHNILGSSYMAKGLYDEGMKELNRSLELDPKIVDAHMKKGVFFFSKGQLKEAETELVSAVNIAPELLSTRLLLASYYMRQHKDDKAVVLLKQGVSGKKLDAVLYNNLAAIMFTRSNMTDGLSYLLKSKEADPDYLSAYFNLAVFYAAARDHEKALNEYRSILKREPNNLKAIMSMAAMYEMKGQDAEAYKLYKLGVTTKSGPAYLSLASYYVKKKENKKAHEVLNEAISQISRNVEALEFKARLFAVEKKYKEALKIYDEIYSFNQDLGINHKIALYMEMNNFAKADEEARRYIAVKPYSAFGYLLQSAVFEKQNRLDSAIDSLKSGLKADPTSSRSLVELGNLYARKNERKFAMDAYERAYALDSEYLPALFAQAVLMESGGNKAAATQKYREILMKSETFMPAINNLAYIYVDDEKGGKHKEGLRMAFSAFRLAPESPAVMDTLGYALAKNGFSSDAVKMLEKAKTLMPDDSAISAHLAMAQAAQTNQNR
ncbi:MAG: PEP-CTERM system TPR-repeat protein PrsT [Geobacteraceae bacterium]|nr:PEP-CTERM system TPR-repeat protein PrsT [Geobacteraceae bacterium]